MRQTTFIRKEDIDKKWYIINAEGKTLGRLASQVSVVLTGKNKVDYTPHNDCGDHVIIINTDKIELTGKKLEEKIYYRASRYPGNLKKRTAQTQMDLDSTKVVYNAVWGMVPHNKLGRKQIKHLHLYSGAEHKQQAQQPKELVLNYKAKV